MTPLEALLNKGCKEIMAKTPQHMEPGVGIEPTTYALQVRCSTTELTRQGEGQS